MAKYAGRGFSIYFEGSPVTNLRDIGDIGETRDLIDASVYGEDVKDYVLGQGDGSENTFVFARDPADSVQDDIIDTFKNDPDATPEWTVVHTGSGDAFQFTSRILSVSRGGPIDGLATLNVGVKVVAPGVTEGS